MTAVTIALEVDDLHLIAEALDVVEDGAHVNFHPTDRERALHLADHIRNELDSIGAPSRRAGAVSDGG